MAAAEDGKKKKKTGGSGLFGSSLSAYVRPEVIAASAAPTDAASLGTSPVSPASGSTAASTPGGSDAGAASGLGVDELPPSYASLFRPAYTTSTGAPPTSFPPDVPPAVAQEIAAVVAAVTASAPPASAAAAYAGTAAHRHMAASRETADATA